MGEIDDIVRGVLYLKRAPSITGEFLHLDGGQSRKLTGFEKATV